MGGKRLRNWPFFAVFYFEALELDNIGQIMTILDRTGHCASPASPACQFHGGNRHFKHQFHCCPVKIPAVFLLPLKLWVFQQILIVCGLGSAPTGQEALSPGQRPGLKTGGRFALTGQKLNRINAFALSGRLSSPAITQGAALG